MKSKTGYSSDDTTGTPRLNVAVACVAESITRESEATPENSAETVKSARSNPDPVKTIVSSVFVTVSTTGKEEAANYSY